MNEDNLKRRNGILSEIGKKYGARNGKIYCSKGVYCVELGRYFVSAMEAGRELGIASSNISKVCTGLRLSAGKNLDTGEKLTWKFIKK